MTLVLSMNPFLDPEGDPPPSVFPPIWDSERCTKTCLPNPATPCSSEERFTEEPPCRRVPDHVSVSRIAYFKRKFVDEDDEAPFSFRTYCQTVAPVLEERAHVLRLSLEKMRFIDDPEAFLRRSVLVNNLLRRLRAEILLQSSDWCFPPNPAFSTGPCILPSSSGPAHQVLQRALPTRICLAPQAGPPLRKRFRMVRGGPGDLRPDCPQTCCCIYAAAAAAGHYLHLPFSVYDTALAGCPAAPQASSFFQLTGHSKLGLTVAVEDHDDDDEDVEDEEENEEGDEREEEEEEEEEEEDEEQRQAGPSADDVSDKLAQKSRTTLLGHKHGRTANSCVAGSAEEEGGEPEEEEDEEEEKPVRPCPWDSERDLHRFNFWHRRAHRQ
ncbi:SERTA domain-containing protein 4-like [Cololabis saira]|uniref:SERTA domain-containing protein 4-like n=1 Tax=Cololabis saira TaxID=129043 RepID=UPI002AD1F6FB|nr:SERTA domain-containing protein 4-like [Cololabis saira]XP_061599571.1 SERTA domain-containing protein 4-like [Cololabis saira]